MNWNAIAAVGEILAALAVLVSVLYLARQIQQSTRASTSDLHKGIAESYQGINELTAGSPDLADIVVRGAASFSALPPAEALRFGSLMMNFFNIIENRNQQLSSAGLFTPEQSELSAAVVRKRLVFPGISEWWSENTDDFSEEFVRWVESVRATAERADERDVE